MAKKITETGPVGLRGVRNTDLYNNLSNLAQSGDADASALLSALSSTKSRPFGTGDNPEPYFTPQQYTEKTPYGTLGNSQYDEPYVVGSDENAVNEIRYENQPWYDTLANGVGKMLGTAGTTFVSSLVGLPYGLFEAANQGRASAIWDNSVTKGLADVDKWLEENMTNYKSQKQQNSPWYDPSNLFSMNFIADDVIKNAGFTLGAAASMALGGGSIGLMSRALNFTKNVTSGSKTAVNFLSALFSATGEGMIEARQGVEERNKLEMQKVNDALAPEEEALALELQQAEQEYEATRNLEYVQTPDGNIADPAYLRYSSKMSELQQRRDAINQRRQAAQQQIEESGRQMGNRILFFNQALLTAGNLIQFSKGITKSYDAARHAAETSTKIVRPRGIEATLRKTAGGLGKYEITGSKNWGRLRAGTKGLITEGSEEMNQQWIQSSSGAAFNEQDVNDYWKAKLDPESYRDTTRGLYTLGNIISKGFKDSWGDLDQWQQFVVGGITGLAGSYMPNKVFNQDKTKSRWNPMRYGEWSGGALNEIRDYNTEYNQFAENIDDLNKVLADENFPERVKSMVGHTTTEKDKDAALEEGDKKAWKDADDKQTVHDIQAFLRAGKLDDLRAIYDEIGEELDDEDIEALYKSTTKEVDDGDGQHHFEGPYVDRDGNRTTTPDELRASIKHNAEELHRKLNSYLDSIAFVQKQTGGNLTKDQEDNLAYLHHLGKESLLRSQKIMADRRSNLPNRFLFKTDRSVEQLAKEYTVSDLVFSDEDAPEGYLWADTTGMTDDAFADFFQTEIMRGGNINPVFAETAEERAAREEEEKTLTEAERKKKARERLSKKWLEGLQKQQKDAEEQWKVNRDRMVDDYFAKGRKEGRNESQLIADFEQLRQDIADAAALYDDAGKYNQTFHEYMRHPEKVDEDKRKEEENQAKSEAEKQAKDKFGGKSAKDINQEIASGEMSAADVDDFLNYDFEDITDEDVQAAKGAAQESKEIRDKQASLKQHIQEQVGDNPTADELALAEAAMRRVDDAALEAETAADISLDSSALLTPDLEGENYSQASVEDVEASNQQVVDLLSQAFNAYQEDLDAQDVIPTGTPVPLDGEIPQTGDDETTKVDPEVVAPDKQPSATKEKVVPTGLLGKDAAPTVMTEVRKVTTQRESSAWRSTTTRNVYGKSTGTYHEDIAKQKFGETSKEYKRSKAIWEYLRDQGAFDRMDNTSADMVKAGDTIHFMVKFLPQVFDKEFSDLTAEEKPYSLVILMLDDHGEVLGDLPLSQLEPKENLLLGAFQSQVFEAFEKNWEKTGATEALVDSTLQKDGVDNLGLVYDVSKNPMVASVKQKMRGAVPFVNEYNTLNDVAAGMPMTLGVRVSEGIATKRGEQGNNRNIVLPQVGKSGQPYMLLATPSGEQMAIPFYTNPFNPEVHRSIYMTLSNAIFYLLESTHQPEALKQQYFQKHMDVLEGLLQVMAQEGKAVVSMTRDTVSLNLQSLTNPDEKIEVSVPNAGSTADMAKALAAALAGVPINVSLEFLNSTIETGFDNAKTGTKAFKLDYNTVIGEAADINLPKGTTHTVNSWFTIELSTNKGVKPTPKLIPRISGKIHTLIGGRNLEIDLDRGIIADTNTGEIINDSEEAALLIAEARASHPLHQGKDFIQVSVNGETRVYDVKNKKFKREAVNTASQAPEVVDTTAEETHAAQSPEVAPEEGEQQPEGSPRTAPTASVEGSGATQEPGKGIDEIEEEVKKMRMVNRRNEAAWKQLSDEQKVAFFSGRAGLVFNAGAFREEVKAGDTKTLFDVLTKANNAAKGGVLTVEEAVKPMMKDGVTISKEKERAARRWTAKNLPMLSSEERMVFVDKLTRSGRDGGKMWGSYRSGVIEIQRNAPMGTVYHEAFHYVVDMLLSEEERQKLFDAAQKEYGLQDVWETEERLANDFRRFAMDENATGIVGRLKRWFRNLWDKIKRYNRISDATVNQLFRKINNGEFAERSVVVENFDENHQRVLREIRNVQSRLYSWENLDAGVRRTLEDAGMTTEQYNSMSLEEKQQYVKCLG